LRDRLDRLNQQHIGLRVSPRQADQEPTIEPRHPRETTVLFGHDAAESALLAGYQSGRMAHAWLIGGAAGIGKATLAYRMARFVLAHPDPAARKVQSARSLAIAADDPIARRVAAKSHSDLLVLERTAGDTGQLRTVITVDEVRRTVGFFGSTAGAGGWRICVVDSADELKFPEASNALLKVLEEPPPRSLFLLVSHAPGRLLPTIRSRCRRLTLRPLSQADVVKAAAAAIDSEASDDTVRKAAAAADGSVARALALLDGESLAIRDRIMGLLAKLPATDARAMHALGDSLDRSDDAAFDTFVDTVRDWLSMQITKTADTGRLAQLAEVWEKFNRTAQDVEVFNLERKPMVFAVFGSLAEAAR
jgi:DNA polymerase III subunit delta'